MDTFIYIYARFNTHARKLCNQSICLLSETSRFIYNHEDVTKVRM